MYSYYKLNTHRYLTMQCLTTQTYERLLTKLDLNIDATSLSLCVVSGVLWLVLSESEAG